VYRARVGSEDVATGETRTEATEKAWTAIKDALSVKWASPVLGRADTGETCVGVLTGAGEYSLYWYNADGSARSGCECGRLELHGFECTLAEYVRYSVLMRNGMDCYDAANLVLATGQGAEVRV